LVAVTFFLTFFLFHLFHPEPPVSLRNRCRGAIDRAILLACRSCSTGEPFVVRFTLDRETCRRLGEATQACELCDCDGRVIGFFLPEGDAHGLPPAGLDSPLSAEEIERRRSIRTGRTLDEILRSLDAR